MEKVIEILVNKLLGQRDDVIREIRDLNQNTTGFQEKLMTLERQVVTIDVKIESEMQRLERIENTKITSKNG